MSVRIRLSRRGAKKRPFYWIVAADSRAPRDGRFIEKIGTYNPMLARAAENRVRVDAERARHWLAQGARPSERVARMFAELGLGEAAARRRQTKQHKPKAKALERAAAAAAEASAATQETPEPQEPAAESTDASTDESAPESAPTEAATESTDSAPDKTQDAAS